MMKAFSIVGALAAALLLGSGCGDGDELGRSCRSNADCGTYTCIFEKTSSGTGGGCKDITELPGTCSPACSTQADCRKIGGASFSCALATHDESCNPTGVCLENYSCTGTACRPVPES